MANSYKEVKKEAEKENQVLLKAKTVMRRKTRKKEERLSQFTGPSQDPAAQEGASGFHLGPPLRGVPVGGTRAYPDRYPLVVSKLVPLRTS